MIVGSPSLRSSSSYPSELARIPERSTNDHLLLSNPTLSDEERSRALSISLLEQQNRSTNQINVTHLSSSYDHVMVDRRKSSVRTLPKSKSHTGLKDLEKVGYFPHFPQSSASGVQRCLKTSVIEDMCSAIAKQMVGDIFMISSGPNERKIINHLYQPVFIAVKRHFSRLPARYALSVNPDDVAMHMRLMARQERHPHGIAIHAHEMKTDDGRILPGLCEVVVVATDRDSLLDAITRGLTSLKGNIVEADIITTTNSIALDRFVVKGKFVSEEILRELQFRIENLLGNEATNSSYPRIDSTVNRIENVPDDQISDGHDVRSEWLIPYSEIYLETAIGSGRSGHTYSAHWRGTQVAVKVVNLVQQDDAAEDTLAEFYREVTVVGKLRHPNICLFLGAAVSPPTYCLIFEYMENGTLTQLLRSKRTLIDFFRLASEIAQGMNYLHLCCIIHRDLKSGNLLLDSHGTIKVADFGLSCVFSGEKSLDMTAETGTYRWMAPEVIRHEPYCNKADVYSYGVVLWEMITKEQPFKGMSPIQAAFAVARQNMRPALLPYTPPKLAELVELCWHHDPQARPNFGEILEMLPVVKSSLKRREFSALGFTLPS